MNTIDATIRNTSTKGQVKSLRIDGNVPAGVTSKDIILHIIG